MVLLTQILGLVILAALVVWLYRRARKRSQQRYEQLAPQPPTVLSITSNGSANFSPNGSDPELEEELNAIYGRLGHPEAFAEAKRKVTDLAADLVERDGIDMDEALEIAYRRSLTEHREYLAAKGLA